MKRVFKQWLAGLLSVVLLLTLVPAAALAEEADGATGQTAVEQVQALIDELPETEEITAETRDDVQAQIDAIDAAMLELSVDEAAALDTARYDAAVAALLALDAPSALEQVQALIDALPDAETITADNRADVEAQLIAIDEAKQDLTDGELDALDITRYMAAIEALLALDDMAGADEPMPIAATSHNIMSDGPLNIAESGDYTITGNTSSNTITVTGGTVTITLNNVSVTSSGNSPLDIQSGNVTLILESGTTNTFTSNNGNNAAIHVAENAYLTIRGDGTLNATSSSKGAGIGGNYNSNAGHITIESGTVTAKSNGDGAGIGGGHTDQSGKNGVFQSITISGGYVRGESGSNGAGIGNGCWGKTLGTITISGGIIHAKTAAKASSKPSGGDRAYDIGYSHSGSQSGGTISITGGVIFPENRGIKGPSYSNCLVVPKSGDITVYGNPTIKEDFTIPSGKTLTVPSGRTLTVAEGATLTVAAGATLTNNGTIKNEGALVGEGTVNGTGKIDNSKGTADYYGLQITVPTFESLAVGYAQPPQAQYITILNSGTRQAEITKVEIDKTTEFDITGTGNITLQPGQSNSTTWTIQPKTGLAVGQHSATVTVTYSGEKKATTTASFTVLNPPVTYLDEDGTEKTCKIYTYYNGQTSLSDGWYYVNGSFTIDNQHRIQVSGNVHLILADGCTWTANWGINVSDGNSLTIYGQKGGTGTLTANGSWNNYSGIGGYGNGIITINGGIINAYGGAYGAGIGGNSGCGSGTITINGGTVNATGGFRGAGIGPAASGSGGTIVINGGTVTAKHDGAYIDGIGGDGCSFSTGTNGHAVIRADSIGSKDQQDNWSGVIFEGNEGNGQVYGNPIPTENFEVKSGETLTVPEGKTLTVADGVTLNNGGTIQNSGHIYKEPNGNITGNQINGKSVENFPYKMEATGITYQASYGDMTAQIITIKNTGATDATIQSVSVSGDEFKIVNGNTSIKKDATDTSWKIQPSKALSAGKHTTTITVTYGGSGGPYATTTAEVALTVSKASATVKAPEAIENLTYNGTDQKLVTAGSVSGIEGCGEMQYSLTEGSGFHTTIPTGKDADTYTVYWQVTKDETNFTYSGNTSGSVEVTISKTKSEIKANDVTATYGEDIKLTATVNGVGVNGIALMSVPAENKVRFSFSKGGSLEADVTYKDNSRKDSGTAEVTIAADEVKNYLKPGKNEVTVSYGGSVNLNPEDSVTMEVMVGQKTLTFNFHAQDKTYDGNNTIEGIFDILTDQLVSGDDVEIETFTATTADENTGVDKPVTVTVTGLKGAEAGYYTPGTATGGTVNISKAKIGSVTAPTVENPAYNGEEQAFLTDEASGVPDGATITYFVGAKDSSAEPTGSEDSWGTMENIKAKDAGTYTVWYKVAGGTNYENIEPTKIGEAKIGQKEVALTWAGYNGLTYSGNPVNVTATADTGISGENVNVTVGNGTQTNAGTYEAEATGLTDGAGGEADNYKLPSNVTQEYIISPVAVSFAIDPEDKAIWPTDETNADPNPDGYAQEGSGTDYALSMTYDSYTHTASVAQTEGETVKIEAGTVNGFSVTYKRVKDSAGGSVTEDAKDSVRDAGTYEIWVSINPTEDSIYNYVFSGHGEERALKIGTITVKPYATDVSWAHLKYVYHGHTMHPEVHVLTPFKADDVWMASGLPTGFDHEHPEEYTGDYLVAFAETSGSDVGVYPVEAKLYGKNAGNYTITDPTGNVTITPAPVTFTVGDNTWVVREDGALSRNQVTLRPAWGAITVAPDPEAEATDHQYPLAGSAITDELQAAIKYQDPKTGETVESPTEPGTYEVWVEIGNTNFRHSGGSDGALRNVGELVITNNPSSVRSYTVKFDPGYEGAPDGPKDMTGVFANQTVVLPPVSGENADKSTYDLTRPRYSFLGWSCNGRTYKPNEEFHMPAGDVTFKAEWIEAVPVGGTVKRGDDENAPVLPGATVTLKQGAEDVAEAVTDENGAFDFGLVTPGIYNLEVRYRSGDTEIVKTFLVEAGGDGGMPEVYLMPDKALNTVVEVAPGITAAVNLDRITGSQETSEVYTEDDKKTVENGGKVEFKMSVSGGKLTPDQTEEVPVPEDRIGMVLDLELTKTVTKSGTGSTETDIHDTKIPVTTVIHLPAELQGKSCYTIYRFHDMSNEGGDDTLEMQTITTSPNSDGEYLKIVRDGTAIEIHAEFYSTYVLTWEQSSGGSGSSRYPVNLPSETDAGTIASNPTSARPGSRVTLTVTPNEGYHLKSLTVTNRNGKPVDLTDNGDGTYTFTMPYSQVTVEAEFVKCGSLDFTDLDTKAWYHDYTDYVIDHGLMQGIGGRLFEPNGTVTRAQMVMVLWNMSDKPVVNYYMTYSDVTEGIWYSEAIRWATSEGIVGGYGNGKFGPNDPITREQMAAMIYRYEQKYGDGGFTGEWMYRLPYTDLDQISDWAFEPVAWCNMKGAIKGKGNGVFDPKGLAKRSEMAAILTRYCGEETGEE